MKENLLDSSKWSLRSPWVMGQLFVWGIILICSFIAALLMRYTTFDSSQLTTAAYGINALALFVGGFISGRKAGQRGWYYGGLQGIIYAAILLIIGFLAFDSGMVINPVLFMACAFGISAIGGVIGVNSGN
ncbi:TIGR04086 family membrane protein [Paenactinomyces guangxiensis]|uniref:TIGR04086 family membrane protein n=1 Tax=Paenactinomyces guangxiensis TaxID=1490290 RepID=A0A7W1WTG8_9BACL|nr:TIGR04086 family membrane protein [Paenactinomyces guangxiensis]MBA4495750.1 TIGR04086 family membrane protein [Paenactinomyces guangxiensis]MBH8592739.1 TIGR04086 family membrane protein [Paenactinomyces guangxiensis]